MPFHSLPDSYTKLLIHSDDTDDSTTFIDSSASGHTITASGNVKHNSVPAKFGKSSIEFDGSGDELDIASTSDFQFGTGDFTIDWWMMPTTVSGTYLGLISLTSSTNTKRVETAIHGGNIQVYSDSGTWRDTGFSPPVSQWTHVAIVRNYSAGTLKLYANGVEKWSVSNTRDYDENSVGNIGNMSNYYTGYMDEIRVSKGIARWTDSFVPPNKPYSVIDDDFVTDVAGIEDESGVTTVGKDLVIKSDPSESSADSVFSVNAKDGTELMNMSANGVLESGLLKVDEEGAVQVYNPHAGIYMTSFSDTFAPDEVKNIQMKTNVNVFGSMFINVTGNYGSTNAIGAYEKCFSVGVNSVNTGIFSAGSSTIVDIGGTEAHLAFGTPAKPDAVTYNIPVTNRSGTYTIDFYFNVVFKGYISGIISIKLEDI